MSMKAAQINTYGGVEVITIADVDKPSVQNDQVLVEVTAASINPFDYKLRMGLSKAYIPLTFPVTLGGDFAGKIVALGEHVGEYALGDNVFGSALILNGGSGSMAEFAMANVKNIAKAPLSLPLEKAASLPLVGSSAVQAIEEHINIQKDQKILIHGGAGGIGSLAIQIAKLHGAYVITTVSTNDIEFVHSLGADEVIDYKTQAFEDLLKDIDAVFDTVGGETRDKSLQVLKKSGILVSMSGEPSKELVDKYTVTAIGQNTKTVTAHLSRIAELIDRGSIHPAIDKEYTLDNIQDAFTYQEKMHPRGKVVIKIK